MTNFSRHFRGLLIATVALAMSTGLAYAAHPAADRHSGLSEQANSTETSDPGETEGPDETEAPDETDSPDASESPDQGASPDASSADNCATDPTGFTPEQLAAVSHGSIVCWAAQQQTPEGWDNHGAWVSHWAKMNHGHAASAAGKAKGSSHRNAHASKP
jgi:hypothetical protein